MQFTMLAVAALLGVAHGQANQPTTTQVHVVNVGKDPTTNRTGQRFWPEKIQARVGDMVQFQYWGPRSNHTATESTFDGACFPKPAGVNSGYQPANEAQGQIPVFTVMINDTTPKWFYCAQGRHCQSGMSMVINENPSANSSRTLENYKQLAARAAGTNGTAGGANGGTPNANGAGFNVVAAPLATMLLLLNFAFVLL